MVRLNDILREVKTQLNSISRQAKRAEHYKVLKQSLKEAELDGRSADLFRIVRPPGFPGRREK